MKDYFLALRPKQWVKNFFIFAAIIFAKQLGNINLLWKSIFAFIIFCFLASSGYLVNDLVDLKRDREHPIKSKKPLPAGRISPIVAGIMALVLFFIGSFLSFFISLNFFYIALFYLFLHFFYSLFLKNLVIIDILTVASFYVLRVIAGGVAIEVFISPWLLVCTFFLALFIAVAKRRHELVFLGDNAQFHRGVLKEYSPELLDQFLAIITPSTLVAYSLYTFTSGKSLNMIYTIPLVVYGLLRYLYLVYQKEAGGQPTEIFLEDWPLKICLLLWILISIVIFYRF